MSTSIFKNLVTKKLSKLNMKQTDFIDVYVTNVNNQGQLINCEKFINEIKGTFSSFFNGCKTQNVLGNYLTNDGKLLEENCVIITTYFDNMYLFNDCLDIIVKILMEYKIECCQECVMIILSIDGKLNKILL